MQLAKKTIEMDFCVYSVATCSRTISTQYFRAQNSLSPLWGQSFLIKFPRVGTHMQIKCPTYARPPPPPLWGLTLIGALVAAYPPFKLNGLRTTGPRDIALLQIYSFILILEMILLILNNYRQICDGVELH